jgi:hypothetical protein
MKQKIERSNEYGKFTEAEIRAKVAETKRRMAQPGYKEAEARRMEEAEKRAKAKGIRFPELAKRGTKPVLVTSSTAAARQRLNATVAKF